MEFSIDFFRDEVRCGFYIPTAVKQAWAAELEVLSEINRICEKYGIKYFADWGTILGAVRHGGFVPWDDDLDICMLRDDYIRFRQVVDAELPREYVIHDYERQEDHWLMLARVVNNSHICFDPEYLNVHHNFPYLAGVDIFVKDYLYRDPQQEKARDDEVMHILAMADGIVEGRLSPEVREVWLERFEKQYGVRIDRGQDARHLGIALYRLAEQQMGRVRAEDSDSIGQIFPFILKGGQGQDKRLYEEVIRLPFENTTIPVPASYDTILRSRYGDYLKIHKVWTGHNYPFFESQCRKLMKNADFELPEYRFPKAALERRQKSVPLDRPRRVVFVAIGARYWDAFAPYFEKEMAAENTEVCVVALPVLRKDCYGQIAATDEELAEGAKEWEYPEGLPLVSWFEYDAEEQCPDRVYIQDVYDTENPCLSLPPLYHSVYLKECAGEIILIPPLRTDDFTREDKNDLYALKHYATMPGVVWADRVMLPSECIRERYLEALVAWAGEDTGEYWERKLEVVPGDFVAAEKDAERKKTILFMIGANEVAEYGEKAGEYLQKKFAVLRENADSVDVLISLYPPDPEVWEASLGEKAGAFLSQIETELSQFGYCDLRENSLSEIAAGCDAYYGSASPLVVEFVRAKKPVMIADYRV